jgi:hypothetical protein
MYVDGPAQDYAEAVKWFRKAADQGNADGELNLGLSARPRTSESGLVEFVGDWGFPGESRDDIVLA